MNTADIGLIGLAVMGANLARNLADKKIKTLVYNRTAEKTKEYIQGFGNEYLSGEETLEGFMQALTRPRRMIILVKAGQPVDEVLAQLSPYLEKGDTVIDCGNSSYHDTIRRSQELSKNDIHFVGCGISGGEEGALHGPSLMPGGSDESWKLMKPVWEKIAAKDFSGNPCVTHVGENGAGHYVKMVHNGIEYAVMQMMAEAYDVLRKQYGLSAEKIAEVFKGFQKGKLNSYLFDIVVPVLERKDEFGNGMLIDHILDKAEQKGTGKLTAIDALERGVSASTIAEAVFARVTSSQKDLRVELAQQYQKPAPSTPEAMKSFVTRLENALYSALLSAYAQGFHLISAAAKENKWSIDPSEVARIWQGGCIIRAQMLKLLTDAFKKNPNVHLLQIKEIQKAINEGSGDWRAVVSSAIHLGTPVPALSSALSYLDAMTSEQLPANLIQGLRDFFGAHTYERNDKSGKFHAEWNTSS